MQVLAIDPGFTSGWAVGDNLKVLGLGKIKARAKDATPERIRQIHDGVVEILNNFPDVKRLVLENQFAARNTKTTMILSRVVGGILVAAAEKGVEEVVWYAPQTIKRVAAGHGGADKPMVVNAVLNLFDQDIVKDILTAGKVKGALKIDDIADALAILYTYYEIPDESISY